MLTDLKVIIPALIQCCDLSAHIFHTVFFCYSFQLTQYISTKALTTASRMNKDIRTKNVTSVKPINKKTPSMSDNLSLVGLPQIIIPLSKDTRSQLRLHMPHRVIDCQVRGMSLHHRQKPLIVSRASSLSEPQAFAVQEEVCQNLPFAVWRP